VERKAEVKTRKNKNKERERWGAAEMKSRKVEYKDEKRRCNTAARTEHVCERFSLWTYLSSQYISKYAQNSIEKVTQGATAGNLFSAHGPLTFLKPMVVKVSTLFYAAFGVRLLLILYGMWHDAHSVFPSYIYMSFISPSLPAR
jgi:hypothetical protein